MSEGSPHVLGGVWNTSFDACLLQQLVFQLQGGGTFSCPFLLIGLTANARKLGGGVVHAFGLATQSAESRLEIWRAFVVVAIAPKQLCMSGCNLTHPQAPQFDGAFFVGDELMAADSALTQEFFPGRR